MLKVEIQKRLGDFVLHPSFEAEEELVVLLGPSGSGKSLTLQAIAGLMQPDKGRIELPSGPVFDSTSRSGRAASGAQRWLRGAGPGTVPTPDRGGEHRLRIAWLARAEQAERLRELVTMLGLEGLEGRLPGAISGGQQQRVALGRALAARPRVLLLDEPFNALDAPIRHALRREVARLRRQLGLLALFVTHDLQEAYALADRIAVYDAGAVLQCGPRAEVFRRPASVRVAQLLETRNIFEGHVVQKNEAFTEVETPWFRARARAEGDLAPGSQAALAVRPEHVILLRRDRPHANQVETTLDVELIDEEATGTNHRLFLRVIGEHGPTDCVIEADLSAHPYEVMGVANSQDWRVALTLDQTVAIALKTT